MGTPGSPVAAVHGLPDRRYGGGGPPEGQGRQPVVRSGGST
jgi:hypothetical protein